VRYFDPQFTEVVRLKYFDQLIASQPHKDIPVSTINIDEATLDKFGQFPFPRDIYARIIEDLYKRDAGLVVFGVMMPEADRFGKDGVLAATLEKYPVVLPQVAAMKGKNDTMGSPAQVVGQDPAGRIVEYPGVIANVPSLQERAAGVGVVNTFPETADGSTRRMPLVVASGDSVYPALALETLRLAAKDTRVQVKIGETGVEALRVPKFGRIDTDSLGRVWIDTANRPTSYSLTKLPESFEGGIVIVGLSAAGLVQPVATGVGEVWPQDLQAMLLGTMLNKTNIVRSDSADMYELLVILFGGLLVIFFGVWRRK
jgi:adenylate cyclase